VSWIRWIAAPALAFLLWGGLAQAESKKPLKDLPSFGQLQKPDANQVRTQALNWLQKDAGKNDPATLEKFNELWKTDRPLLDKVSGTFALGNADAAKLLSDARNPEMPAPTAVPSLVKDGKLPLFFRANLALAYGKALCNRKVFDEGLEALKAVKGEDVVDPGAYFFHRAVAEHALMLKEQADDSIDRLLVDVVDAPERYRMVAALMHFDMVTWSDKDLGWIARKMGIIKDRLDLTRGGPKTRAMQREVLVKLDEKIKEMENKAKGSSSANGGSCPGGPQNGGPPSGNRPSSPATESALPSAPPGKGEIDMKKIKEVADVWGKLPPKERDRAMVELTRGMPPKYRDAIESYFKQLESKSSSNK
jgi:hypothetical protein